MSISISDSLWVIWTIKCCWKRSNFIIAMIFPIETFGFFVIRQFHQKMENVISTSISSFIILSEARIMVVIFHVSESNFGISIERSFSLLSICHIASKPFVKPHCTHDIVIRHRVETVKGILNFLFGANPSLETRCRTSG